MNFLVFSGFLNEQFALFLGPVLATLFTSIY